VSKSIEPPKKNRLLRFARNDKAGGSNVFCHCEEPALAGDEAISTTLLLILTSFYLIAHRVVVDKYELGGMIYNKSFQRERNTK
jgi:hypothetical protein